jgi:putative serine protease PepD
MNTTRAGRTRLVPVALLTFAVGALGLAGCAIRRNWAIGAAPPPTNASAVQQDYVRVVERVQPSVVQITTDRGLGSGIVFDNKGNIVTNVDVVAGASTFQVRMAGSANTSPASLVGAYRPYDTAVIHLNSPPSSSRPAQFGSSNAVRVGDIVLAMGNAIGPDRQRH